MSSEELFQRLLKENADASQDFESESDELSERKALRRVAGISTELEYISEA